MIVPMKKVSIVVLAAHKRRALRKLAAAGVMHVHTEAATGIEIDNVAEKLALVQRAIGVLGDQNEETAATTAGDALGRSDESILEEALTLASELAQTQEEIRGTREELDRTTRELERLSQWGDFDPADLHALASRGVVLRIYALPPDRAAAFPDRHERVVLSKDKNLVRFVARIASDLISPDGEFPDDLDDFPPLDLPVVSTRELRERRARLEERFDALHAQIAEEAHRHRLLDSAKEILIRHLEFESVAGVMDQDEQIAALTGFVPTEDVAGLRAEAPSIGWALLIRDPEPDDNVPTKTKNPRAVGIIRPVFQLLGTTPGYHELDISFWFLLFFILFFAMIIGDGGYGAILFAVSIAALIGSGRKAKKTGGRVGDGPILLFVLSVATIVWGALTGTWFGADAIAEAVPFRYFVFEPLATYNPRSAQNVQLFCFIVGTVQLSIAHVWNFIRELKKKPVLKAFAQLGWLAMVIGLYSLVLNVVLAAMGFGMPTYALYLVGGGLGFVLIFSEQRQGQNFLVGVGKGIAGLMTTFLDSISAFSDIISYIRLFAVGLASVEIAKSFNAMASPVIEGGGFGIVAGVLILLLGHTLNLAMGGLSVIVHGVRLNMLEFSGHLGLEWAGAPFRPFGRSLEQNNNAN